MCLADTPRNNRLPSPTLARLSQNAELCAQVFTTIVTIQINTSWLSSYQRHRGESGNCAASAEGLSTYLCVPTHPALVVAPDQSSSEPTLAGWAEEAKRMLLLQGCISALINPDLVLN